MRLNWIREMTKIVSAVTLSDEALHAGMVEGFSDYIVPMRPSLAQFRLMMRQRGLDPSISMAALEDGRVTALWLVSLRGNAAYLIASATAPEARGKGLARKLAEASLERVLERGADSFQTEVIDGNTAATRLYESLGMKVHRRLDCYALKAPRLCSDAMVRSVEWSSIVEEMPTLRDWKPSWQNSDDAITAVAETTRCVGCFTEGRLVAAAVLFAESGTVAQVGVHPLHRRQGLCSAMLAHLGEAAPALRLINADARDEGFAAFMVNIGARRTLSQLELLRSL